MRGRSLSLANRNTPGWQYAVSSGILGWVLDAFDFFVVIFLVDTLAANFHVEKSAIVWTISIALAMRPVGALIFGSLADRFGRRLPLVACVLYFSVMHDAERVRPELRHVCDSAGAVWHRHGRLLGRGSLSGCGECAASVAAD